MLRVHRRLIVIALLAASCGSATPAATTVTTLQATGAPATPATTAAPSTTSTTAATTTSTTARPTTTTRPPPSAVEPLRSYRFEIAVALAADQGDPPGAPVHQLSGERTTEPVAMRIFGDFKDEALELITDGSRWWDLDDLDLEIGPEDILFFLGGNGFLLPEWMSALLDNDSDWASLGLEELRGVTTDRSRRRNIIGGVDWEFGDLAQLDVWRDELGQLVKLQAWFATGDNTGFPVSTWEITERNPQLTISLPDG